MKGKDLSQKIYCCLGFLNSMINSGEGHTSHSMQVVADARKATDELVKRNTELITILAWEVGELSEGQAMKRLNLDRVSLRVLREEYLKVSAESLCSVRSTSTGKRFTATAG